MSNESPTPKPPIFIDNWAYLSLALSYLTSVLLVSGFVMFWAVLPLIWSGVQTFDHVVIKIDTLCLVSGLPALVSFIGIILFRKQINLTTVTF